MLMAAARPLRGCIPRTSPKREALLKCFIPETVCLAGIGNCCFWTCVPCLFNMEKSSSLWDIPYGTLPESKNRELMSFGDSNLEAQNHQAQNLASVLVCILKCFSEHFFFGMGRGGEEGRADWQDFKMFWWPCHIWRMLLGFLPLPLPHLGKAAMAWLDRNIQYEWHYFVFLYNMLPRSHSRASTEHVWSDPYLQCQEVGIAP